MSGKKSQIIALGALFLLGSVVGSLVTAVAVSRPSGLQLPETLLNATGATGGEQFSIATGPIDENAEGLFILDHLTGELSCWVPNYRNGRFYGVFKANVAADLPVDRSKEPHYLITTGGISQRGATGNSRAADSIVYVLDENTGAFAAYTLMWNRTAAAAGNPQQGQLSKLDTNIARTTALAP